MLPPHLDPPVAYRALCPDARFADRLGELGNTPFGRFEASTPAMGTGRLDAGDADLIIVGDAAAAAAWCEAVAHDVALVVVLVDAASAEAVLGWLERGAEEVLSAAEWVQGEDLPRRLRVAIERKRLERLARTEYATDLGTGLPHQQQLVEHMSQLLALREREPAPMAVLALRLEGLASAEAQLGAEAANVLRRKIAVRLRSGVRASDVVASLGDDSFAVLLGALLTPADAERVGAKLLRALLDPFKVAGQDLTVAVALGIGRYPEDGAQPDLLLRRATGLAASTQASGPAGSARFGGSGPEGGGAANDPS